MSGCFRCHLCGKICLFTTDSVHGHLQTHKINWSAYKLHYLSSDQQPEAKIYHDPSVPWSGFLRQSHATQSFRHNGFESLVQRTSPSLFVSEDVIWMAGGPSGFQEDRGRPAETNMVETRQTDKVNEFPEPSDPDSTPNGRDVENSVGVWLTDDPEECCLMTCGVCQQPVTRLLAHVVASHTMTLENYRQLYPEPVYNRKTHHR